MSTVRAASASETDGHPRRRHRLLCVGVFCLAINDVFAKWLGQFYPVAEVAFSGCCLHCRGGILLISCPGGAAFSLASLAPLVTAFAYGMLTARMSGRRETIWASMFYATAVPLILIAALLGVLEDTGTRAPVVLHRFRTLRSVAWR